MNELAARRRFGPFEVDLATGEIWQDGLPLKLAPQPFRVLAVMVRRPGALVTRDDLRSELWPDGTTVEFDQGVNYCIRQLRMALGDDAREPRYIETVPKRGYRFLADVAAQPEEPVPAPDRRKPAAWRWLLAVAAVFIFVAASVDLPRRVEALPDDPVARQLFLEAEHLAGTWEAEKVEEAAARYEAVTRRVPEFARAWAGRANADVVLAFVGPDRARALADSEVHARMAVALDGSLGSAHAALGHSYWQQWQWQRADASFRRGIELEDGSPVSHQLYGLYLASIGRKAEAIAHATRAVEIAPLSGLVNYSLAQVYLQGGEFEAAIAQAKRTLTIDRHFPLAYHTLIRSHAMLGQLAEAGRALADAERLGNGELSAWRAYVRAREGRIELARQLLARDDASRARKPLSMATVIAFAAAGEIDRAFDALANAVASHAPPVIWLKVTPELAPLRSDPRFLALLERMNSP